MSQSVAKASNNPANQLRQQLTQMGPELRNALPSNISPEKFQRVVLTVVNMSPDLLNGDRKALLGACMRCAADGLVPDGREAALVMFKGKPQYMPMVTGLLKRARNSGEISTIGAHVIYEHDEFLVELGDEEKIVHKPAWSKDRGKMVGVYAIAKLKDGGIQRALLSATEVEKIKGASASGNNGPWGKWPEEMWKKSALRRLTKYLPMDAETERMETLLRRDDEPPAFIEGIETAEGHKPSKLDALEHVHVEDESESVPDDERVAMSEDPPAPSPAAADLIAAIEATETTASLEELLNRAAVRATVRKLDSDDARAVEIATLAQRRLFTGPQA